jgi:hypothetical protein
VILAIIHSKSDQIPQKIELMVKTRQFEAITHISQPDDPTFTQ